MSYREDKHGHLIDKEGKLLYDPRCYGCLSERPAKVTAVRVDIPIEERWQADRVEDERAAEAERW